MNQSLIWQLVRKDLSIMKVPAAAYVFTGFGAVVFALAASGVGIFIAQLFFISAVGGAGIHAALRTVVEERRGQNLPFIMSLPITILDYTKAKLIANALLVGGPWLILSAASYVVFIGDGNGLTRGMIPFVTIILVAVLLLCVLVVAASIVFASHAATVVSLIGGNLGTQAYVWWIRGFYDVRSTILGNVAVWNSTYVTVVGLQVLSIAALVAATLYAQSRKTEFL